MIVANVNFPNPDRTLLVIVIEKDNLDRMRKGDPITMESAQQGGKILPKIKHPENLSLIIAYEEDDAELYRIAKGGNLLELVRWLERNREWHPNTDGIVVDLKTKPS